jgi:hypothetical protein
MITVLLGTRRSESVGLKVHGLGETAASCSDTPKAFVSTKASKRAGTSLEFFVLFSESSSFSILQIIRTSRAYDGRNVEVIAFGISFQAFFQIARATEGDI